MDRAVFMDFRLPVFGWWKLPSGYRVYVALTPESQLTRSDANELPY